MGSRDEHVNSDFLSPAELSRFFFLELYPWQGPEVNKEALGRKARCILWPEVKMYSSRGQHDSVVEI